MSGISNVGNQPNNGYVQNTNNVQAPTNNTPGSGNVGQSGQVPPSGTPTSYSQVQQSVRDLMTAVFGTGAVSSDNASVVVSEANERLRDIADTTENDKVTVENNEKRAKLAEKREKLEESLKKLQDIERGDIGAILKAFFQMLGAALMAVLGALLSAIPLPGFAVLGGLMIASAVLLAIQSLDGMVKAATGGMGIMGSLAMAFGASKEDAMKADMGFGAALAVGQIALAIAQVAFGRGDQLLMAVKSLTDAITSITTAVTSAVDVAVAGVSLSNAVNQSEGKKAQAGAKTMEALMQMIDDAIDQAIKNMIASGNRFNEIMDDTIQTMNDIGNSLGKVKFAS